MVHLHFTPVFRGIGVLSAETTVGFEALGYHLEALVFDYFGEATDVEGGVGAVRLGSGVVSQVSVIINLILKF